MVPIRKTTGSLLLCIDYRKLNQVTVGHHFQTFKFDNLLEKVAGATWLSKIDLQKESQYKMAFYTPCGKYAFRCMPFGLRNAPDTFQRCMDKVLEEQAGFSSTYIRYANFL